MTLPPSGGMTYLCIDIGNTRTHLGLWREAQVVANESMPTPKREGSRREASSDARERFLASILAVSMGESVEGAAFCSVVPSLREALVEAIRDYGVKEVFQLTWESCPIPIQYPKPEEIGQDRLAVAVAAHYLGSPPALVMDVGTAVTFDVITRAGYEGGIIAPGLDLMSRYLHEQTALLPSVDASDFHLEGEPIGKSTVEAMKLGCLWGFRGMMQEIQDSLVRYLEEREGHAVTLYATGGSVPYLPKEWLARVIVRPHMILEGLATAATRPTPA